jgi:hypothetical protein
VPQHAARSTQHAARSTQHAARSAQHAARDATRDVEGGKALAKEAYAQAARPRRQSAAVPRRALARCTLAVPSLSVSPYLCVLYISVSCAPTHTRTCTLHSRARALSRRPRVLLLSLPEPPCLGRRFASRARGTPPTTSRPRRAVPTSLSAVRACSLTTGPSQQSVS